MTESIDKFVDILDKWNEAKMETKQCLSGGDEYVCASLINDEKLIHTELKEIAAAIGRGE